jgi:general secretion pathway protein L
MSLLAHIVLFLDHQAEALQIWSLTEHGLVPAELPFDDDEALPIIALVAPEHVVVRWHNYEGLSSRQAEAAARLDAASASINAATLHVAAQEHDGTVVSGSMDSALFARGLDRLKVDGIDPDHVWPLGLVLPDDADQIARANLGGAIASRSGSYIFPDEPALTALLSGERKVREISQAEFAGYLRIAISEPPLDLRSGLFAKKSARVGLDRNTLKLAAAIVAFGLLCSLLLALVTWFKVDRAIARENEMALVAARKIVPGINSAAEAPAKIEQMLGSRGGGQRAFTIPASALWRSMQPAEGASLRDMRYGSDKLLLATVTAATVDPVNRLLLDLQRQGYKVTATPRQEANGVAAVAITVRAP